LRGTILKTMSESKKYVVIETWNGEGYSDSGCSIVTSNDIVAHCKALAEEEVAPIEMKKVHNLDNDKVKFQYSIGEDAGAVCYEELEDNMLAIAIEPLTNSYTVIRDKSEVDIMANFIKKHSEEYKETQQVYGICHENFDGGLILCALSEDEPEVKQTKKYKAEYYLPRHLNGFVQYRGYQMLCVLANSLSSLSGRARFYLSEEERLDIKWSTYRGEGSFMSAVVEGDFLSAYHKGSTDLQKLLLDAVNSGEIELPTNREIHKNY